FVRVRGLGPPGGRLPAPGRPVRQDLTRAVPPGNGRPARSIVASLILLLYCRVRRVRRALLRSGPAGPRVRLPPRARGTRRSGRDDPFRGDSGTGRVVHAGGRSRPPAQGLRLLGEGA